ncbi:hypothetical protein HY463_01130 [Candidatus Peregrinibacteria bacterium]|nr:hypothetical protein [Candidatus Peregrinibacteria bacterium]
MIDVFVLHEFKNLIPEGERSDFINEAIKRGLEDFRNKKAFENIDKLREELDLRMTTKEIIKLKNYGRK